MRKYRQIASKALKTQVMLTHKPLASYIPVTGWYSREALRGMLERYPTVFIKPDKGGGGGGIVRVKKSGETMEVRWRKERHTTDSNGLPALVGRFLSPARKYLVQQGIEMATVGGRPFDIRIMLQKPGREWLISGMAAKVAARGQFVTNHCKGGVPHSVADAVERAFGGGNPVKGALFAELESLSRMTAEVLDARFPGIRELGIDVGPDREGHPWIFEVNTRPNFFLFRHLKQEPAQYRRILHRHKKLV